MLFHLSKDYYLLRKRKYSELGLGEQQNYPIHMNNLSDFSTDMLQILLVSTLIYDCWLTDQSNDRYGLLHSDQLNSTANILLDSVD